MSENQENSAFLSVANIVHSAGGTLVGRTRLQKVAYLLEITGLGSGFSFEYRHYGPFSQDLAASAKIASFLGLVEEKEEKTDWGGFFSTYTVDGKPNDKSAVRDELVGVAVSEDSVVLELAATAAFLSKQGCSSPWKETKERKPEKATKSRIDSAKSLYRSLSKIKTPTPLPNF